MKKVLFVLICLMFVTVQAQTTINALFMQQAAYSEADVRAMTADFEAANPEVKVNLEFVPYESLRDKTITAFASGGYDVVLYDVVWPAEYAENGFLLDVTERVDMASVDQIFPGAWTTVTYQDKYYGLPWILDTKYLYYNTDMLEQAGIAAPPKTWAELLEQAQIIKDKGIVEFPIVWSWAQAEAVICDYTTILAANGGTFFADGKPAFQTGGGLAALQYMVDSQTQGLSNPNSKEYLEEDVRRVFSSAEAAFALNWTYMYNLTQDPKESKVVGKVGIVPAPGVAGSSKASAVNGSMGLGITANSQHPDESWNFISFLASQENQNKYAKLSLPIWKSSYTDPAVTTGQEAIIAAADVGIGVMTPRPTVPNYAEVSSVLQKAIQDALLGSSTAQEALESAASEVEGMQ
jgi:multiple sugar transport system substrate-binding protein